MLKAQNIYWTEYKIDITTLKPLPSLALAIFRQNYYNDKKTPFGIPNDNADTFIQSGYQMRSSKLPSVCFFGSLDPRLDFPLKGHLV